MTAAQSPITTLDQAKAWLVGLPAGGTASVGPELFGPAIVQQVFQVIANSSDFALSGIAVNLAAAQLTGTATVLGETCVLTFSFAEVDDGLILVLAVARPKSYRWQPLPAFTGLSLGNLVAQVAANPDAGAVTLAFGASLFAGGAEFDALLTLPAVPGADWTLAVSENTSQPFSTELMTALSGGTQALSLLPASSFPLERFTLSAFEIAFSPGAGKCSGLKLGLAYDPDPPWQPFGDRFAFTRFEFDFVGHFDGETSFQAVATAKTLIGPAHVDASVQFDMSSSSSAQAITVYLDADTKLSVGDTFTAFGVTLPHNFPDIELSVLSLGYYVSAQHVDFALSIDTPFEIAHGVKLDKFHFNLGISYQSGVSGHGELLAVFSIPVDASHVVSLELSGAYDTGGALSLSAKAGNLPAGDLIAALLNKFGIAASAIPAPMANLQIQLIELDFTRTTGDGATDTFDFSCEATTTVAGAPAGLKIRVTITYDEVKNTWSALFKGVLTLKPDADTSLVFEVVFSKAPADTWFLASFNSTRALDFGDIAKVFGFQLPPIPSGLNLDLTQVTLRYDAPQGEASSLFVGAASANPNYGKVSYITQAGQVPAAAATRQHVFIIAANRTLSLSQLPLVGPEVAKVGEVALEKIQAAIAFPAPLDGAAAKLLNTQIAAADPDSVFPRIPEAGLAQRILLAAELDISGTSPHTVSIPLGGGGAQQLALIGLSSADRPGATSWFDVQKSIGPVSIQKVGLRYADSKLWALMNASVSVGPLEVGLLGLGMGSPLTSFEPSFTVSGVTVSMQAGEVALSGALVGAIDPVNLYGELSLQIGPVALGALAGYATYEGDPSFFLYAVLDAPLGGPAFCFVTGVAAGLGINRQLLVPPVTGVAAFPLVQWAVGLDSPSSTPGGNVGDQVLATMTTLSNSGVVAPKIGEYWFAAGIRFTSFELLDTYALLTMSLGKDFEVDILGLSSLSLPPKDPVPLAFAQLAIKASFKPTLGLVSVEGQLTSASYVLSKDCHLTGGFAFYMWYAGAHAGEFVLSLGGYSPRFTPPDYYPVVPRLGLNWQVTDQLSITGNEYFALTSSAVMAGGSFSAVWQSGSLRAWFDVQADFLLVFQPLHYYISASIDLGASFSIDLLFTTLHTTIHIGVDAEIWGPDFSGEVNVDLDIISFTIGFGSGSRSGQTQVNWNQFATTMLPSGSTAASGNAKLAVPPRQPAMLALGAMPAAADDSPPPPPVLQINSSVGIIQSFDSSTGLDWLVDGHSFQCTVVSNIPLKTYQFLSDDIVLAPAANQPQAAGVPITPNINFGVGPAGISPDAFDSNITLQCETEEDSVFDAVFTLSNISKAMWEQRSFDSNGVPQNVDPLNDTTITNVLTGFTLVPTVPPPDHTLPILLENLQYTIDPALQTMNWSAPVVQTTDPFTNDQTVQNTIGGERATANRTAMIAAINRAGFAVSPTVDVATLADPATSYLLAPTVLRYLAEAR
jgi:hypothetical protein